MGRGGWGKYQSKNRLGIGDIVQYQNKSWMIYSEHGHKYRLEEILENDERYLKNNPSLAKLMPNYVWKIRKIKRMKNLKKYDWYQLLRRRKNK